MTVKLKLSILCLMIILSCNNVTAQEVYLLDLDKSIELALEKSHSILRLRQNLVQSEHELKVTTSSFKTHVDLELTVPEYTETISEYEDTTGISFYNVKQLEYEGELNISQPLPTDGSLSLSSGLLSINDYNEDQNSFKLNTRLEFEQPIEALYIYNSIRSGYKKAKLNYELAEKELKREELELVYDVSSAFYSLVSAKETERIARQSLQRQEESNKIAQNKYKAGLIMEVEALQMEVDLADARNDYDLALVDYNAEENYLKQVLGLSLKDSILVQSDMSYRVVSVDVEKAVEYGLKNRIELREDEIAIELSKIEIKRRRAQGMINGDITAYYDLIGTSRSNLPVSFSESFNNSTTYMKDSPGNFGVALNINIPIIDWGENRAYVNAAKASLEINQVDYEEARIDIERNIRNTVNRLQSSLRRLQMLEKNLELANKSFAISQHRFSNGDIDTQAFALDRERLNNANLSYLNAYISYKLYLADLMRSTFYDFENDNPLGE